MEIDYEQKDKFYYFETSEIRGVIIKRASGNFCIKASVKYVHANYEHMWFAKIRIEDSFDGNIQIKGKWGGSREDEDFYDEDLIENPNSDFPIALSSMRDYLTIMYNRLCENNGLNSVSYASEWVKKLKKYNN